MQLIGIICVGVYSNGVHAIRDLHVATFRSIVFPNIIFGAFIIISSVIAMSYALGQLMPELLIRIFNALGMILYFVSACVTTVGCYELSKVDLNEEKGEQWKLLFAQVGLSFANSLLYGVDMFLSFRKTLRALNSVDVTWGSLINSSICIRWVDTGG